MLFFFLKKKNWLHLRQIASLALQLGAEVCTETKFSIQTKTTCDIFYCLGYLYFLIQPRTLPCPSSYNQITRLRAFFLFLINMSI